MFAPIEQEAIILNAAWEMVDDMVNYAMFVKSDEVENTNLMFKTSAHARLFNVLLCDFLSLPQRRGKSPIPFDLPDPPSGARPSDLTFLFYLRQICGTPTLNRDSGALVSSVEAFADWLEGETFIEHVWFPTVNVEVDLKVMRLTYLKICGDIGKHSLARLQGNVERIRKILADHGHQIDEGMAYAALPEFYEWFHDHLFIYHSSSIAEFLNNIRLGIYEYLKPEFNRSYERVDPAPMYRYNVPKDIGTPLAREMYWALMNKVRGRPFFPKFTVSRSFKSQF
jgi:hypothetical protein